MLKKNVRVHSSSLLRKPPNFCRINCISVEHLSILLALLLKYYKNIFLCKNLNVSQISSFDLSEYKIKFLRKLTGNMKYI